MNSQSESSPSHAPLYRQVKDILAGRIARNEWQAGDLLPSEPKLAVELGVSAGTVRKALDEMTMEKLVVRRQGRGTFVASQTSDASLFHFFKLVDRHRNRVMPDCTELSRTVARATAQERKALVLEAGARVLRAERLRSRGGINIMVERVVLPVDRFAALQQRAAPLPKTLYDFYQTECGVTIRRIAENLTADAADAADAEHLGLAPGTPILRIERQAFSFGDQPVEWRLSRLDTRQYSYLNIIE